MATTGIPDEVRRLVYDALPTMEHVDLLLFLVRVDPTPKTVAEAAAELPADAAATERRLDNLVESRLVTVDVDSAGVRRYRYAAAGLWQQMAVKSLVEAYRVRPVSLIRMVYERPPEMVQKFAEAFRIRKPDE